MKSLYGISHKEGDKMHLYFLPGQTLSDGSEVNFSFRVQCDRSKRDSFPEFTIFSFDVDDVSLDPRGTHYIGKKTSMCMCSEADEASIGFKEDEYEVGILIKGSNAALLRGDTLYKLTPDTRLVEIPESDTVFGKSCLDFGLEMAARCEGLLKSIDPKAINAKYNPEAKKTTTSSTVEEPTEEKKVSWIDTIIRTEVGQAPSAKKDGFYISQANWKLLIRNIKRQVNTLIVGPTGTGKTSCIKYAAEKLGLKLTIIDMGATIDPISSLLGVHRLKDGHSVFDYAQFTKAIQEPGIILLDEVNRAPMGSGNVLFPCLDDRRVLPIEIANGDGPREIKIHPEVSFIATANLGAEYTGTSGVMDRAFLNRFFPLELTYLPEKIEKEVLKQRTGIDDTDSDLIVKVANTIRNMNKKMELSIAVSVRETLMISTLVADGWGLGDAMKTVYLPMFEGTNSEGERSRLYKVLASY